MGTNETKNPADALDHIASRLQKARAERAQAWWENNERKLLEAKSTVQEAEYTGWVSWADFGPHDGLFPSAAHLRAWCEDHGVTPPTRVWGCYRLSFHFPDAEDMVRERAEQLELVEGSADDVEREALEALQAGLDRFNALCKVVNWFEDTDVCVVLRPAPAAQEVSGG